MENLTVDHVYAVLPWSAHLQFFVAVVFLAAILAWAFFWIPGSLLYRLVDPRRQSRYALPVTFTFGVTAFTFLSTTLGLIGLFHLWLLIGLFSVMLVLGYYKGAPLLPALRFKSWLREEPFLFWATAIMSLTFSLILVQSLSGYADGHYLVAAGQMSRTGAFSPLYSEGQTGMAAIAALIQVFIRTASIPNSIIGWGPLYVPFLLLGAYAFLRELFGDRPWVKVLAAFVFLFPVAMKATEIRGSVTSAGFALWSFAFFLHSFRTGDKAAFWGSAVALGATWNFSPPIAVYSALLFVVLSVRFLLRNRREEARQIWRLLWITNLIELPFLVISFRALLGGHQPAALAFVPGFITLAGVGVIHYALSTLRDLPARAPSPLATVAWLAPLPIAAFFLNPPWAPMYSFFFFNRNVSFLDFNFGCYGLPGWIFAFSLLVATAALFRKKARLDSELLWSGALVAFFFQALSPILLRSDWSPTGSRAYLWDIWKDTGLYWLPILFLPGFALLIDRAEKYPWFKRFMPSRRLVGVLIALLFIPWHSFAPYRAVLADETPGQPRKSFLMTQLSDMTFPAYFGPQTYPIPLYWAYALDFQGTFRLGRSAGRADCIFCSSVLDTAMRPVLPVIDFLMHAPLEKEETLLSGNSVLTPEIFLDQRVRYRDAPDSVCPLYVWYVGEATQYEFYWRPLHRIRRNNQGMAYTVTRPKENLVWVQTEPVAGGDLEGMFSVPRTGEYELYWGTDGDSRRPAVMVDGVKHEPKEGYFGVPIGRVLAGSSHRIRILRSASPDTATYEAPLVVHPLRYWYYERYLMNLLKEPPYPMDRLALMRHAGIPSAEITMEEVLTLMGGEPFHQATRDERLRIVDSHKIRYIVMDPLFRTVFPKAETLFAADPGFRRIDASGTPVFERVRKR